MISRLFIAVLLMIFLPGAALACSCGRSTFEDSFKRAATVVTAEVVGHIGSDKVILRFNDVWKGSAPETKETTIASGTNASCGPTGTVQPDKGTRYLFYLGDIPEEDDFHVRIQTCGRNGLYADMERDVIQLKAYKKKLEAINAALEANPNSQETWMKKVAFYREYGDLVNAKATLSKITKHFDGSVNAWAQLSEVTYQQAEKISPLGRIDTKEMRMERKKSLYEEALQYADKTLTLEPENQAAKNIKNGALLHLGRTDEIALSNVDYSNTRMSRKHFDNRSLQNVSFKESSISGLLLTNSQLNNVSFENARLGHAKFLNTTLNNVDFNKSEVINMTVKRDGVFDYPIGGFENATIKDSSFKEARLGLSIKDTKIVDSDFESASFEMGWGDKPFIYMSDVTAQNTKFRDIKIHQNGFSLGKIEKSVFKGCDFSNAAISAHIVNSDFSSSNLDNVDLTASMFDCATKWPEGFDPVAHGATPEEKECNGNVFAAHDFEGKEFEKYKRFGPINLEGANFKNATLLGASFNGANLKGANFTGAILDNADFRDANLEGASFKNVKLYSVNFGKANLRNTIFTGANLTRTRFDKDSNLNEANLELARLWPTDLEKLPESFEPEKHQFVYWANSSGHSGSEQPCASLEREINMEGKDVTGVKLSYACLRNVNFKNAKLDKATLYNADLTGANLDGASLTGTKYSCDNLIPEKYHSYFKKMVMVDYACRTSKYTPPQLAGADLSGMDLRYGTFKNGDLRNADFRGSNLANVDFRGADITGAKFEGAKYNHNTKWPEGFDYIKAGAIEGGVSGGTVE